MIKDIQKILGVTADGIWGARSQAALDAAIRGFLSRLFGVQLLGAILALVLSFLSRLFGVQQQY